MNDVTKDLLEALLKVARMAEDLKKPCGTDPESPQAIRNAQYMNISYAARSAIAAAEAREMRDEYRSASCDDVARRVDECMTLRAERDALAAKLAELEGQEPTAWMNAKRDMASFIHFHEDDLPLFARPVPVEPVNVEFGMRGENMFFKIGNQSFLLDYKPAEPGEFEFMQKMLLSAFSMSAPQSDALEQVRAEEREACAKACDELFPPPGEKMAVEWAAGTIACANAIRARGQA